jgi:hypothetical protein
LMGLSAMIGAGLIKIKFEANDPPKIPIERSNGS